LCLFLFFYLFFLSLPIYQLVANGLVYSFVAAIKRLDTKIDKTFLSGIFPCGKIPIAPL